MSHEDQRGLVVFQRVAIGVLGFLLVVYPTVFTGDSGGGPSDEAKALYGSSPQLDYVVGDIEDPELSLPSVDLIVMFEVIEHLHGPSTFLDIAARSLGDEGVLEHKQVALTFVVRHLLEHSLSQDIHRRRRFRRTPYHRSYGGATRNFYNSLLRSVRTAVMPISPLPSERSAFVAGIPSSSPIGWRGPEP